MSSHHSVNGAIVNSSIMRNPASLLIRWAFLIPKALIPGALIPGVLMIPAGCSSIINDPHVPVTLSFSDNSRGSCVIKNKRFSENISIPGTHQVGRSYDALVFDCPTDDGRIAHGSIPSHIDGIIAGNILIGGIIGAAIDAETDNHRKYPPAFVIPVPKAPAPVPAPEDPSLQNSGDDHAACMGG